MSVDLTAARRVLLHVLAGCPEVRSTAEAEGLVARHDAERDEVIIRWLCKKAAEYRAGEGGAAEKRQRAAQAEAIEVLADKLRRGAARPNNLLMPTAPAPQPLCRCADLDERLRPCEPCKYADLDRRLGAALAEARAAGQAPAPQPEANEPGITVDALARHLSAADVFVNHGDYPGWEDLSTTPGAGRDEYRKAARYLLRRLHVTPHGAPVPQPETCDGRRGCKVWCGCPRPETARECGAREAEPRTGTSACVLASGHGGGYHQDKWTNRWPITKSAPQPQTAPDGELTRLRDRVDEVERKYTFDTATLKARIAALEALAADATEYRVLLPEHGGIELHVRRSTTGLAGGGWAVSTMARGGGRAWTQEGWQDAISALSVDRLFCWPTPETAVAEARTALGLPGAEQGGDHRG